MWTGARNHTMQMHSRASSRVMDSPWAASNCAPAFAEPSRSVFKVPTTLNRSLLVILIPGVLALAPWISFVTKHAGFESSSPMVYVLIFVAATVVGSVFEGLTSHLEEYWDRTRDADWKVKDNWTTYLAREFRTDPIGCRYLARLAVTLYFELSMMCAAPVFFIGAAVRLFWKYPAQSGLIVIGTVLGVLISVAYFTWQARTTHGLLCRTRRDLNARWSSELSGGADGGPRPAA